MSILLIIKIYKTIFNKSKTETYSMVLLPLTFFYVTRIFCKSINKDQIKWSHLGPKLVFWIPLAAATVYVLFSSLCHNRNWTSDTLWNFHTCLIFIIFNSCFHIGDMRWESVFAFHQWISGLAATSFEECLLCSFSRARTGNHTALHSKTSVKCHLS